LAWLLGRYLTAELPQAPVQRRHWPAAFLDGLDAPVVVIYLGEGQEHDQSAAAPAVPLAERIAGAIAGAVQAFLWGPDHG
jgi:hypothetical protein